MHYKSILVLEIPQVAEDLEYEKAMDYGISQLRALLEHKEDNFMVEFNLERMINIRTAFAREVHERVDAIMERFYCETENNEYREFEDCTEELQKDYEGVADCMRLPEGRIVDLDNSKYGIKFKIIGGQVYEAKAGFLKHDKRTKRAKKMKALPDYPLKKVYKSFHDFVDSTCRGCYNEETNQYGYWYNPNGIFDYYSIGGRWPATFLVKDTCKEFTLGACNPFSQKERFRAPEGYMWVCGARMKDIEWDIMRQWNLQILEELFYKYEKIFSAGESEQGYVGQITEEGIIRYGKLIYKKDETLDEFINRYRIPVEWKYPIRVNTLLTSEEVKDEDACRFVEGEIKPVFENWSQEVDKFIDALEDEMMLVFIDYHI